MNVTGIGTFVGDERAHWEYAWLVERPGANGPLYHSVTETGVYDWTPDVNKALRFARRVDADSVAGMFLMETDARAVEHGWLPPNDANEPSRET